MPEATRAAIDDFLLRKRIAIAGVSRRPQDFSRMLMREFVVRGYDIVPVNPLAGDIEGIAATARIGDIQPPPEAVLLMTSPEHSDEVVRDAVAAGVKRLWLYRGTASAGLSAESLALCSENKIALIAGECPFMYLPNAGAIHSIHRFFRQVVGAMPK